MKKGLVLIPLLLFAILVVRLRGKTKSQELGKLKLPKPPKIRIVYSRKLKDREREKIGSPEDVIRVLRKVWSNQIQVREEFVVLHLDNSNRVLGYQLVGKGGINQTVADVRLIFALALKVMSSAIIIAHNHPSGNLMASSADKQITKKIAEIAEFHNIRLLDSIILTKDGHLSFSDVGLL